MSTEVKPAACGCTCGCGICNHPAMPDYPVTCAKCGVTYGPGGEVSSHRPGGDACMRLAAVRKGTP